jgi:predicted ester cyclase
MAEAQAARIEAANAALLVRGDVSAIGDFFTPNHVTHLTDRDVGGGFGAIRRYVDLLHDAFAGVAVDVEVLVEAQDRIAWQRTVSATHRGGFMGFPATGRELVWRDMVVSRFEDGLIAEEWLVTDMAERMLLARKLEPQAGGSAE